MDEDFFTVDELSRFLKVPKSWIYSRTREKTADAIPRINCGKYIRFRLQEVLSWLESRNRVN